MAGLNFSMVLQGAGQLSKKLDKNTLADPIRLVLTKAVSLLQREVLTTTPVDTGRLRGSWVAVVDQSKIATFAQLGTNVPYGEYLEHSDKKPRGVGRIPFLQPAVAKLQGTIGKLLSEARSMLEQRWGR